MSLPRRIHDGLLDSGVRIIGDPTLLLDVRGQTDGNRVDETETETYAQQMLVQLHYDEKLRRGRSAPLAGRVAARAVRRLKRLF